MRFVDEYRDEADARQLRGRDRPHGDAALDAHGDLRRADAHHHQVRHRQHAAAADHAGARPGCPVCVTPLELIDRAIAIAARPEVIFTSFGDMLRVPGSQRPTCSRVKAAGRRRAHGLLAARRGEARRSSTRTGRWSSSPSASRPPRPANAMAVWQAQQLGLDELLHPRARTCWCRPRWRRSSARPRNRVQGFLAAGHVCAVMGYEEYEPIAAQYRVPIVVTGFEPLDMLQGVYMAVRAARGGPRGGREPVRARGHAARATCRRRRSCEQVFEVVRPRMARHRRDPASGFALRAELRRASTPSSASTSAPSRAQESAAVHRGQILQGLKKPHECPAFGTHCTPEHPLGAPMVSSEGACAAYYQYARKPMSDAKAAPHRVPGPAVPHPAQRVPAGHARPRRRRAADARS